MRKDIQEQFMQNSLYYTLSINKLKIIFILISSVSKTYFTIFTLQSTKPIAL